MATPLASTIGSSVASSGRSSSVSDKCYHFVDDNGVIVDGHAVWEELRGLGHTEIQVVVAANCSSAEIHTLRLALNRVAEEAAWDKDKLRTDSLS